MSLVFVSCHPENRDEGIFLEESEVSHLRWKVRSFRTTFLSGQIDARYAEPKNCLCGYLSGSFGVDSIEVFVVKDRSNRSAYLRLTEQTK